MRFASPWKFLTVVVGGSLVLSQGFAAGYDRTSKWWLQGDVEIGYQQIDPKVPNELSKSGLLLGGRALLEYRSDSWGAFGAGMGIQQTWQDGETDVRIQKYILRSVFFDGSYLYPFANNFFWLGWLARVQVGEGARYDFFSSMNSVEGLLTTGPQIRFNIPTDKWDWVVGAAALTAVNSSNRTIINIPIYAGISIPLGKGDKKSQSGATGAKLPLNTELKPRVIHFQLDKSYLSVEARKFLSSWAKALIANDKAWENLVIIGHADVSGAKEYNQRLSIRRANTVKEWLVLQGVPAERIKAEGYGVERLLPGINNYSASNRRAELIFEGELKGQKIKDDLNALPGEG